jgi:hypothetical protein
MAMTGWRDQIDNEHLVHSHLVNENPNGSKELEAHLVPIHDGAGKVVGKLTPAAAASWDAMVAAAAADGIDLRPTSAADTFRPLSVQQNIFKDRYRETDQGNGSRKCNGKTWFLRKGEATAACPGTSNHGKGEAVDFQRPNKQVLPWMEQHAKAFGWQWELSSEEWHVHYLLGDASPPNLPPTPGFATTPTFQEDDDMTFISTPDGRVVLLHAGKLIHVEKPESLDPDINKWDLTKDPATWKRIADAKGYGPVIE